MRVADRWTAIALAGILFAGCSTSPLAPFEPEISSTAGTFELQATGVTDVTTTERYAWTCDGSPANVNQATVSTAGSAVLRILDAESALVYERDLLENGTFQTGTGAAGEWTVEVALAGFDGDLNFRVESP